MALQQVDFYTGEPVTGSPNNSPPDDAAQMASFGKWDYDPNYRSQVMMNQQPCYQQPIMQQFPGGYGYNTNPNPGQGFMNPPVIGLGSNPYYNQQQTPYQQMLQQQQALPSTVVIPALNRNGQYLPPLDIEERIDQLEIDIWKSQEEQTAKQNVDRMMNGGGYQYPYMNNGFNYYGTPYYNPYSYNHVDSQFQTEISKIQDQAREARIEFDTRISKLAHKFAGDNITDAEIEERYHGKVVPVPESMKALLPDIAEQQRLDRLVPFDNSDFYRKQYYDRKAIVDRFIDPNADADTCFENLGLLIAYDEMEEEMHRRRDGGNLYDHDSNSYKYFVRKKAEERYAREKGIDPSILHGKALPDLDFKQIKQNALNSFSTLKGATLSDDGTLNITCNFGKHAGDTYSVHNTNEAEYDNKRERFSQFIDSIPGSIYGGSQYGH